MSSNLSCKCDSDVLLYLVDPGRVCRWREIGCDPLQGLVQQPFACWPHAPPRRESSGWKPHDAWAHKGPSLRIFSRSARDICCLPIPGFRGKLSAAMGLHIVKSTPTSRPLSHPMRRMSAGHFRPVATTSFACGMPAVERVLDHSSSTALGRRVMPFFPQLTK